MADNSGVVRGGGWLFVLIGSVLLIVLLAVLDAPKANEQRSDLDDSCCTSHPGFLINFIVVERANNTCAGSDVGQCDFLCDGDKLYYHNDIYDQSNTDKWGDDTGYCIRTSGDSGLWECATTLKFDDGPYAGSELSLQGPRSDYEETVWSITGGTGVFGGRGHALLRARTAETTATNSVYHARDANNEDDALSHFYEFDLAIHLVDPAYNVLATKKGYNKLVLNEHWNGICLSVEDPTCVAGVPKGGHEVYHSDIRNSANTSIVAYEDGVCVRVDDDLTSEIEGAGEWECTFTITWLNGIDQVSLEGRFFDDDPTGIRSVEMVTGGKGRFARAHGILTQSQPTNVTLQGNNVDFVYTIEWYVLHPECGQENSNLIERAYDDCKFHNCSFGGAILFYDNRVYDGPNNTLLRGFDNGYCFLTPATTESWICALSFILDDGQISAVGPFTAIDSTWNEIGGAKKFAAVDGWLALHTRTEDPEEASSVGEYDFRLHHTLH